ncbi:MAG TPA: DUF302 domain-containing protein [Streptosporangiaceae bacterium]|nr:DUF302 domain-containing protein [Streptosporangiaceae bacterium]
MTSLGDPEGVVTKVSRRPVAYTLGRLRTIVEAKGMTEYSLIDFSGQAARAGLRMPAAKLLIFGVPAGSTPVMLAHPLAGLDLPLKVLVWDNPAGGPAGGAFVSYLSSTYLKSRYQLSDELASMVAAVEEIAAAAVAP